MKKKKKDWINNKYIKIKENYIFNFFKKYYLLYFCINLSNNIRRIYSC